MSGIRIKGLGHCVPAQIVTNDDLAARIDTSDEWIVSRTGIRERRICGEETQRELCAKAAEMALKRAGIAPGEIGACIVATITPHTLMPSTACFVQRALGLGSDTLCFDLSAACSGFIYALHAMERLLAGSEKKYGLVIGGEALSRIVDWNDRSTCILFGDGAGAAVVEFRSQCSSISAVAGSDGSDALLYAAGPGSGKTPRIAMDGSKVFKFAVEIVSKTIDQVLQKQGMTMEDVDFFVFHQANARIIDLVARRHSIPPEKIVKNLERYGNTSAASIPIALSEMQDKGRLFPGCRILTVGFGGGLTWGGALIQTAQE